MTTSTSHRWPARLQPAAAAGEDHRPAAIAALSMVNLRLAAPIIATRMPRAIQVRSCRGGLKSSRRLTRKKSEIALLVDKGGWASKSRVSPVRSTMSPIFWRNCWPPGHRHHRGGTRRERPSRSHPPGATVRNHRFDQAAVDPRRVEFEDLFSGLTRPRILCNSTTDATMPTKTRSAALSLPGRNLPPALRPPVDLHQYIP